MRPSPRCRDGRVSDTHLEQPGDPSSPRVGSYVCTPGPYGFGRVARVNGKDVDVEFLLELPPPRAETRTYAVREVVPALIPTDTPVFVKDLDRWIPGRVEGNPTVQDDANYRVDLPGGVQRVLTARALHVRCFDVNRDLGAALGALVLDPPISAERRLATARALVALRGCSSGLGALLSASVELLPHQVEVVARVGSDPIIRYILCDEVGLGKTIEAGAIILELLRGNRAATAVVVVPIHLIPQWRRELHLRFASDDVAGRLQIESYDWLLQDRRAPTLLVVDEIHTIVSSPGMEQVLRRVRLLAKTVRWLLLLTATPVMANERATIRLLHLIDPVNYAIGGVERYRFLMDRRSAVQSALLTLSGGDSRFEAREAAGAVEAALPNDAGAAELTAALRGAADANVASLIREARLGLRQYLSDGYRLYHRMLRTRRRDLRDAGYFYRSGRVDAEWDVSAQARIGAASLEDWRYESLLWLDKQPDGEERDGSVRRLAWRYCRLAEALGSGGSEVSEAIQAQRQRVKAGGLPTFPGDLDILRRLARDVPDHGRAVASMVHSIRNALAIEVAKGTMAPKLVAFTSSAVVARSIETELREPGAPIAAFSISSKTTVAESRGMIRQFRQSRGPSVLVCDRAGEIGLNLQFATLILHLDLPFSIMRMEQRIGRLDRIGRTVKTFDHRVYLPTNRKYGPWFAWLTILRDGFRVFDESIADLQLISSQIERVRQTQLYLTGRLTEADVGEVQARIVEERQALDGRYLLERLELSDSRATARLQEVVAADGRGADLADLVNPWWENEGGFVFRPAKESRTFGVLRRQDARPLRSDVRAAVAPMLSARHSYVRDEALFGTAVRLVRPGHAFIDALPRLMDDVWSGKTFALWRHVPRWVATHGDRLLLRLAFVVEASPEGLADGRTSIADGYLQPWVEVVYLDERLDLVSDPAVIALADAPFASVAGNDYDASLHRESLVSRIGEAVLARMCADAAATGAQRLVGDAGYVARAEAAVGTARERIRTARLRLERHRAGLAATGGSSGGIEADLASLERLEGRVTLLAPRLDSIGIVVLGADAP